MYKFDIFSSLNFSFSYVYFHFGYVLSYLVYLSSCTIDKVLFSLILNVVQDVWYTVLYMCVVLW